MLSTNAYGKCLEISLKILNLDPLSPKSDQHQISPCNIIAL